LENEWTVIALCAGPDRSDHGRVELAPESRPAAHIRLRRRPGTDPPDPQVRTRVINRPRVAPKRARSHNPEEHPMTRTTHHLAPAVALAALALLAVAALITATLAGVVHPPMAGLALIPAD
jgi:hypothetical protein